MLKQKLSASLIVINALAGLSIASAAFAAKPPSTSICPEGWVLAPNPQLGCVPNKVKAPGTIRPIKKNPPSTRICPEGWVPARPPLNPQLGCLPNQIKNPELNQPIRKTVPARQIKLGS
ncbi:MAG: hypothetical protein AAF349_04885 [Cyanobacteria bacterium P01_A01_bin.68]